MRGSWLEFNVNKNDYITVRIDRNRKLSAATLLRAIGYGTDDQIKDLFKDVDKNEEHAYMAATLLKDPTASENEALLEFYQKIRPGEPAVLDNAKDLLFQMFFDPRRYELGLVGRYKINKRLGLSFPLTPDNSVLKKEDILSFMNESPISIGDLLDPKQILTINEQRKIFGYAEIDEKEIKELRIKNNAFKITQE